MAYSQWALEAEIIPGDLDSWRAVCKEISAKIVEAGLSAVDAVQNIDFDSITELPPNNSFVSGSNRYQFTDSLQAEAPIILEIEFGVGCSGSVFPSNASHGRGLTPRFRWRVLFDGVEGDWFYCPQEYSGNGSLNTLGTSHGWSIYAHHPAKGFFGFVFGIGAVGSPVISGGQNQLPTGSVDNYKGSYVGAYLTIFIQRTISESLEPNEDGVVVLGPNLTSSSSNINYAKEVAQNSVAQVISREGALEKTKYITSGVYYHGISPYLDCVVFESKQHGMLQIPYLLVAKHSRRDDYTLVTDTTGVPCRFRSLGASCGMMYGPEGANSSTLMAIEVLS